MRIEFPPLWITRISFIVPFVVAQNYGLPILSSTKAPANAEPASFGISTILLGIVLPSITITYLIYRLTRRIFAFEFFPWSDQQAKYFGLNKTAFDLFLKWIHFERTASFECILGALLLGGNLLIVDKGSMDLVPLIVRCVLWAFVVLSCSLVVIFWRLFLRHTHLYNSLRVDNEE
ncbi:hypothetical protein BDR26DRAFT_851481 [Obelidium mucronatum]|nr:hypothetical protein BDR26DRAFT_851481 [Obelidium mucronatum]